MYMIIRYVHQDKHRRAVRCTNERVTGHVAAAEPVSLPPCVEAAAAVAVAAAPPSPIPQLM